MKKFHLLLICLAAVGLWTAVPYIVEFQADRLKQLNANCASTKDGCEKFVAMLGQTGDTFGVASSLFSGLALFAVAVTLWTDHAARKKSRKPLVVCTVNKDNEILIDDPSHTRPREVRFSAHIDVEAANDTALNTSVKARLTIGGRGSVELPASIVQVPLLPGKTQTVEFLTRLDHAGIKEMIRQFEMGKTLRLELCARCESIEGVEWATHVTYELEIVKKDLERLRLLDGDEEAAKSAWQNAAAISLKAKVVPDSWRHQGD